ncbi:MAG: GNAT family N-acetyltransferase [Candidatus Eisenbacteria bacterium]
MFEFREYRADDLPKCVELIQAGHARDFSTKRFRWLHEQAPGGRSAIAVCTLGSRIVGIYSAIRKTVRFGAQLYCGGRDIDPVVHPDYRGRGLFTQLLLFGVSSFHGIDFCFNFANPLSAPGFQKAGWRRVTTLDDRVFQIRPDRLLPRDLATWLVTGALRHCRPAREVAEISPQVALRLLVEDRTHPPLWIPPDRLTVERTKSYLRWRYFDNPLPSHHRWFLRGSLAEPLGLVVCSIDEPPSRLFVLDLFGFGEAPVLRDWLPHWRTAFPRSWVSIWSTVPPVLTRSFVKNPLSRGRGWPFFVRAVSPGPLPQRLFDRNGWYITRGDLEIL